MTICCFLDFVVIKPVWIELRDLRVSINAVPLSSWGMCLFQDLTSQADLVHVIFIVFQLTAERKKIWACYCAHEEVNDIRALFCAISGRALDCNWASEFSDGSRSRTY